MNIQCKGDCFQCEHLQNGDVDMYCPLRMIMIRTNRIEKKLEEIVGKLQSEKQVIKVESVSEVASFMEAEQVTQEL